MKFFRLTILIGCFLLIIPLYAQDTPPNAEFPTLTALEQAMVPAADAVDLAQRFRGIEPHFQTPSAMQFPSVGDEQSFWIVDTDAKRELQIPARLQVIGQHIYLWVQSDVSVDTSELQRLADAFDTRVYPSVRALWGKESNPGIDGDHRLYGLFARHLGNSVAAYFSSRNTFPKAVWPTSNQHEMFLFNLDTLGTQRLADQSIESVVAHEFQHMIRFNLERNEDIWLNEGFSTFTQLLLYHDTGSIPIFLSRTATQLNDWPPDTDISPHYGAADLFVTYFYERYGENGVRQLSNEKGRGLDAFDHVLKHIDKSDVNTFFADWAVANIVGNPQLDGRYGYKLLPSYVNRATPIANSATTPYDYTGTLNQYATDYHIFATPMVDYMISLHLDMPQITKLIPVDASSGQWMWYSNRGDQSDMRLSHSFDLQRVRSATLHYNVWYNTEEFYDYGYVTVSTDGGSHWQILQAASSDTSNPANSAYGAGYTGTSNGWITESISLDSFVGQNILVRFEFIGDDSTTSRGMAIDDVSIPEIGYISNFESDGGGWEPEGWVLTDNRLPQQLWVQVIQESNDHIALNRHLLQQPTDWTVPISPNSDRLVIAISPFAPVTNLPIDYSLKVN